MKLHILEQYQTNFYETITRAMALTSEQVTEQTANVALPLCQEEPVLAIVQRIQAAKANNEKILIAGDYDCDGMCATAILDDALSRANIAHGYYIPNRLSEGYGLNTNTVTMAHTKGYQVIICVDNGVKSTEALALAKSLGISVLVCDHHNYEGEIEASLVLHPKHLSAYYAEMSGAGLAYLLASHLVGQQDYHAILAGICVVSDVVAVWGMNRSLLKHAIALLNQGKGQALHTLCKATSFDETVIGFQITPLINAAGRMADLSNANTMVRFLTSTDPIQQERYAAQLQEVNNKRKSLTSEMYDIAHPALISDRFPIVSDERFHEGIVGLVASRATNQFQKPVMVLSGHHGLYKGSIRSVDGVDLNHFFADFLHELHAYGGHSLAAGIAIEKSKLPNLVAYVEAKMDAITLQEKTYPVVTLPESAITLAHFDALAPLRPFGQGFMLPLFYTTFTVASVTILKQVHIKLRSQNGVEYFLWNAPSKAFDIQVGDHLGGVFKLDVSTFRNQRKCNAVLEDFSLENRQ
ncbi:MAG: single-stranded-DNA-specific exonuclease RecJ [Erysipelotrichaceae bacterium]